ncbi:hypothetical protein [Streptomyces microflavus]|uniref:hypothetical protein n=1 Tax=Streptomyces microflavus TaxID=1919 RepID=UPI003659D251
MSSLVLLVTVLLVLVVVMFVGGLVYIGHRHPRWIPALTLGLIGAALVAAIVVPIAVR